MPQSQDVLTWASLTGAINEIKPPQRFLQDRFFSARQNFATEEVELSVLIGGRESAPFVRKDGEAIPVSGYTEDFRKVVFPTIRIKRPQTASEVMFTRRPGSVIFPSRGEQQAAMNAHLARDLSRMQDLATNSLEVLCSQAIHSTISYSVADEAHFQVDYLKPAGHTLNGAAAWDGASQPYDDFLTAMRLINDEVGLNVTDVVLPADSADAFRNNADVKAHLDNRRTDVQELQLQNQFQESGALLIGMLYGGIAIWEYDRSIGSDKLIPNGTAQFIANSPQAEKWVYYGAIPDMDALGDRLFVGRQFVKSKVHWDPSVRELLLHSRPLPVLRRAGCIVNMTVLGF